MAKGMAGGFPFGAFAVSRRVAGKIDIGDHGGTYCGNPLGCAVACAVVDFIRNHGIGENVKALGELAVRRLSRIRDRHPDRVSEVRGKGLLLLIDFRSAAFAEAVCDICLTSGLFVRHTNETGIRIFPALTITEPELLEGLAVLEQAFATAAAAGG